VVKAKKLNAAKVEAELRLLAAGACGYPFEVDEDAFHSLLTMDSGCLARFAEAVFHQYFRGQTFGTMLLMQMNYCDKWKDYATLAAAIVKERARLDAVKAREIG
jgi:hypothetical protein